MDATRSKPPAAGAAANRIGRLAEHPRQTPDDGRVVPPVLDPDDGRIVARPGWRECMCCRQRFWSADRRQLRLCGTCKRGPVASSSLDV